MSFVAAPQEIPVVVSDVFVFVKNHLAKFNYIEVGKAGNQYPCGDVTQIFLIERIWA